MRLAVRSFSVLLLLTGAFSWIHISSAARTGTTVPGRREQPRRYEAPDLARLVDPTIGTAGDGNVFPGASAPFGMVQWSPDSSAGGLRKPGGYNNGDLIITGFSLTHLSGAGCVALGNFAFTPTLRPVDAPPAANGSPYSDRFVPGSQRSVPGSYAVRLASGIGVRLAVTTRGGLGEFSFPPSARAHLIINAAAGAGGSSNLDGAEMAGAQVLGPDELGGWARGGHFCGLPNRYTVYFDARFSRPFAAVRLWDTAGFHPNLSSVRGHRAGAVLDFDTRRASSVLVQVGVSYVSVAGARRNLQASALGWDAGLAAQRARETWNRALGRIELGGGTTAERRVFYTAFYHALLAPNVFSDADGSYPGFDRQVHSARGYTQYANFSGWDIYRTEIPLLAWLFPRQTSDMMQSLLADARQGGWLPKWPVANAYTGEMDGDSADPILASAYVFGATRFDAAAALHGMQRGANQVAGPGSYQERPQVGDWLRLGYVRPVNGGWGAAATSLEYATDDFAIARLAAALSKRSIAASYARRARNWRRLFNPHSGLIEPRLANGRFPRAFQPASTTGFVEGNAIQYTWLVPQDLPGLVRSLGGRRAMAARLDRFFTRLNAGPTAPYSWAGNEPELAVPWEYDAAGAAWKTQALVRRIELTLYPDTRAGLPGNDDLGTMSAWYVWAALGLYPEIPGMAGWELGSPLFPRAVIHWGRAARLTIEAPAATAGRPYVYRLTVNGHPYHDSWLPLGAVPGRSSLRFTLGARPDTAWPSGH